MPSDLETISLPISKDAVSRWSYEINPRTLCLQQYSKSPN